MDVQRCRLDFIFHNIPVFGLSWCLMLVLMLVLMHMKVPLHKKTYTSVDVMDKATV